MPTGDSPPSPTVVGEDLVTVNDPPGEDPTAGSYAAAGYTIVPNTTPTTATAGFDVIDSTGGD